ERNLACVEGARVAELDEVPTGALVVPIDDDDWLAPDLCVRLEETFEPGIRGYYWIHNILEPRRTKPALRGWLRERRPRLLGPHVRQRRFTCGTNNYAVAKAEDSPEMIQDHTLASQFFDSNPTLVKRLAQTLSLQNRNLSSQTSLSLRRSTISREQLLAAYHRYRRMYSHIRLAEGLAWASPYIDLVAELTHELRLRR
ncbi:MAG: hypothetical protein ACYTDY_07865, partial [Planctomycetota bacterium]